MAQRSSLSVLKLIVYPCRPPTVYAAILRDSCDCVTVFVPATYPADLINCLQCSTVYLVPYSDSPVLLQCLSEVLCSLCCFYPVYSPYTDYFPTFMHQSGERHTLLVRLLTTH